MVVKRGEKVNHWPDGLPISSELRDHAGCGWDITAILYSMIFHSKYHSFFHSFNSWIKEKAYDHIFSMFGGEIYDCSFGTNRYLCDGRI